MALKASKTRLKFYLLYFVHTSEFFAWLFRLFSCFGWICVLCQEMRWVGWLFCTSRDWLRRSRIDKAKHGLPIRDSLDVCVLCSKYGVRTFCGLLVHIFGFDYYITRSTLRRFPVLRCLPVLSGAALSGLVTLVSGLAISAITEVPTKRCRL